MIAAATLVTGGCSRPAQTESGVSLAIDATRSPWSSPGSTGQVLTTDHYRIYTTVARRPLLELLPGFMEATYGNYLQLSNLEDRPVPDRMPIYMMASRREWVLLTENVIRAQRETYLSIEAGGYCYQGVCVFWDIGGVATFSVAAHEGLHQFFRLRLRNPLPLWLEEGLCVSAEGHRIEDNRVYFTPDQNPFRLSSLRSAIVNGRWMPIRDVLPLDAGDVAVKGTEAAVSYYAQLWALSTFLRTDPAYRTGFHRLLADAEAGRFREVLNVPPEMIRDLTRRDRYYNRLLAEPLFRYYISDDLDAFDRQYSAFAKKTAGLE